MSVLVVGSVALDTVETPSGRVDNALGGSAMYFSLAAGLYTSARLVAVVGDDFPQHALELLRSRGHDLRGLQIVAGRTFRWSGAYTDDLNSARTIDTQLNVFAHFDPQIPLDFQDSRIVFLANIDPELQLRVLSQVRRPALAAMDTMNYWIDKKRDAVTEVIRAVDVVFLNDAELRQYAGTMNLVRAARVVLDLGPRAVIVKKGEHGAVLFGHDDYFVSPAYPVEVVRDPTGAGDSFAGGVMGALSKEESFGSAALRRAMIHGSVIASFTVEDFSVQRLLQLTRAEVATREEMLIGAMRVESAPVVEQAIAHR